MKKSVEIIINIIFWLIIVALLSKFYYDINTLFSTFDNPYQFHFDKYLLFLLHSMPGLIVNYYFFYIYLIPLLLKKKFLLLTSLALSSSLISAIVIIVLTNGHGFHIHNILNGLPFFTILTLIIGIIGGSIKGTILWRSSITERNAFQKKHLESKNALLLLKAQLNPHFLFNSLNNIDILIEENPKIASEYLKKLSDILRYVLYETKEDKTDLVKEISQIKDYVELQKIRTDNPQYVNFSVTGEIKEQKIAPMIFLPLIENAFKHSKNKTINNAINIEFKIDSNSIKMICKNYYETGQFEMRRNEGLGIETIEQRLNLLYPETHELNIDIKENWFNVTLSIKLNDGN